MGYRICINLPEQRCYTIYALNCLAMHVSEFLKLYGNIGQFTQQGLEKLNDLTTIFFQHTSNHHEQEAHKQILEKRNRIEELEYQGYQ